MTKRINWDEISRQQKGQRHGTSNAYDELPPVGSWADQQRVAANKTPKKKVKALGAKTRPLVAKASAPREMATCPICGNLVGRMKRHLRRAHGATPGHEHEAPITPPPNDEITP